FNTPRAMVADNDYALGRIVEAISSSPFWRSTVIFVLEDDAQNGPDHVDSHRSPLLVISPWARGGAIHRFANTTDVLKTIEELLQLGSMSQFDQFGRALRDVWRETPDLSPYSAIPPRIDLSEMNPKTGRQARASAGFDLGREDAIDDDAFNRVLWALQKGEHTPYPGARQADPLTLGLGRRQPAVSAHGHGLGPIPPRTGAERAQPRFPRLQAATLDAHRIRGGPRMAILLTSRRAFGAPGIPPRWTQSMKDAVGTAYSTASRVWFT